MFQDWFDFFFDLTCSEKLRKTKIVAWRIKTLEDNQRCLFGSDTRSNEIWLLRYPTILIKSCSLYDCKNDVGWT
jgi:hypothetical protein